MAFIDVWTYLRKKWSYQLFLSILIFALTFLLILPLSLYSNNVSPFYWSGSSSAKERLGAYRLENDRHKQAALETLSRFAGVTLPKLHKRGNPSGIRSSEGGQQSIASIRVTVGIVTVARNPRFSHADNYQPGYLTQVLAELMDLVNLTLPESTGNQQALKFDYFICNVDGYPEKHSEAASLAEFAPLVNKPADGKLYSHIKEKEKRDYMFCLSKGMESDPEYVLLVEDDAIPVRDLFPALHHLIQFRLAERKASGPLAYVKLYHPERLLGYWNPELNRLVELTGIGLVFGSLLYTIIRFTGAVHVGKPTLFSFCFTYTVCLAIGIGRGNLIWIRGLNPWLRSLVSAPTCCTPAMLFTARGALAVSQYLDTVTCSNDLPKDAAMDDFIWRTDWEALYLEPNLFQHIGVYSTLNNRLIDPSKV